MKEANVFQVVAPVWGITVSIGSLSDFVPYNISELPALALRGSREHIVGLLETMLSSAKTVEEPDARASA